MKHIEKVLYDYKQGNIDANDALQECIPFIRATLSRKLYKFDEDLEQEAMIIVFNCLNSYSHNEKCSFSTYVYNNIKWKISRYIWSDKLIRKPVHLYESGIDTEDYEICSDYSRLDRSGFVRDISVLDLVQYDDTLNETVLDNIILNDVLNKLKDRHRKILIMWSQGYTQKEIAEEHSMRISGVQQMLKRALEKSRKILDELYYEK